MKITSLTGDREFIGQEWMAYLAAGKIPFTLRLRENQYVSREGYATWTLTRPAISPAPLAASPHRTYRGSGVLANH
jgi:hypothetical protein